MKKIMAVLCLMSISTTVIAATVTCGITDGNEDKGTYQQGKYVKTVTLNIKNGDSASQLYSKNNVFYFLTTSDITDGPRAEGGKVTATETMVLTINNVSSKTIQHYSSDGSKLMFFGADEVGISCRKN